MTATVQQLYKELHSHIQDQEYRKCLSVVKQFEKSFPDETPALHCGVVALIQLGELNDALAFLDAHPALSASAPPHPPLPTRVHAKIAAVAHAMASLARERHR